MSLISGEESIWLWIGNPTANDGIVGFVSPCWGKGEWLAVIAPMTHLHEKKTVLHNAPPGPSGQFFLFGRGQKRRYPPLLL